MSRLDDKDFKASDRAELSGAFDVYGHANGVQLVREERKYSLIPIQNYGPPAETKWEVNNYQAEDQAETINRFDNFDEAIQYVLQEEDLQVKTVPVTDFYNMDSKKGSEQ